MDCERFDRDQLELLYDELDEVSAGALRRHIAQCPRCQPTWARLLKVREATRIPLEAPEPSVLSEVLGKRKAALKSAPARERLGRAISVVAEYAMRPQLAMAALLLLMVGTSLVFVRSGPGRGDQVAVREVGSPESERALGRPSAEPDAASEVTLSGAPETKLEASTPGASARGRQGAEVGAASGEPAPAPTYEEAMRAYQDGRYAEAERLFSEVSKAGGEKSGSAALHEAHAARNGSGCQRAASYYDEVALRFAGSSVADEAAWHAALCYRALGQVERARAQLEKLAENPAYKSRVDKLLRQGESELVAARAKKSDGAPAEAAAAIAAAPAADEARAPEAETNAKASSAGSVAAPTRAKPAPAAPAKPAAKPTSPSNAAAEAPSL